MDGGGVRTCGVCGKPKTREEMGAQGRRKTLRCKECRSTRDRAAQERRYAAEVGLSPEEYARRKAAHGGRCAICGRENTKGRRLAIDHDHTTGKPRGLLCTPCNNGLGIFGDDPARLEAAARYLRYWSFLYVISNDAPRSYLLPPKSPGAGGRRRKLKGNIYPRQSGALVMWWWDRWGVRRRAATPYRVGQEDLARQLLEETIRRGYPPQTTTDAA